MSCSMLAKPLIIQPTGSTVSISKMSHMGEFIGYQCSLLFYIPVTLTQNLKTTWFRALWLCLPAIYQESLTEKDELDLCTCN